MKVLSFIVFDASEARRAGTGKEEFLAAFGDIEADVFSYSTIGLKPADFLLWFRAGSPEAIQNSVAKILKTEIGKNLRIRDSFLAFTRESVYVKKHDSQEQAVDGQREKYLIVYPFVKTVEWYLLPFEERQKLMNEHIVAGKKFPQVKQILGYSFGIDDQEFTVVYETNELEGFQDLVKALRETQSRKYTLRDTPIYLGIKKSMKEIVDSIL
ncbi:MAG: chlorite dismutase family protein [Candidatus Aenigmarchaeota archaeon]|nr:chlorite dismutase family protein [Candidatus Aenigmarchaeota archaeon]